MADRRDGTPMFIERGNGRRLERSGFASVELSEGRLQALLADHPEVLPVEDIDPSFAPPRTVGREVQTAAGPIDVLFVSPAGLVTIVETKLWRNPEARREVVGQILDYAKELM
jgi:RecB family endonuclease NucS